MKNILALLMIFTPFLAFAENKPKDHKNDKRIKTISYVENDIIPIYGSFKHVTHIDLGKGNTITDIQVGDSVSWKIDMTALNDGVFLKPLEDEATSNLTIITEKRKYYFQIKRSEWNSTYRVNFSYPEEEFAQMKKALAYEKKKTVQSDLSIGSVQPEDWNFSYVLEGDKATSPVNMFDDGVFTYLEFGKKEIPAIFSVDSERNESVVNFHPSGRYVVLEGVYKQLSLRSGVNTTCVFNKGFDQTMFTSSAIEMIEDLTGKTDE